MTTSTTRTKHIEVPSDMFELPAVQAYAKALLSGNGTPSTIAKTIGGTGRMDVLMGTNGHDVIRGGNGNDFLYGRKGNDKLYGQNGKDHLAGDAGKDLLDGGAGDDYLTGLDGNDKVLGGSGNDHLIGGKGSDTLTGGAGRDAFSVDLNGVDRIMDFESSDDTVGIQSFLVFLYEDAFVLGTAANDANDRIIYDQGSGNIYYDADGNGAGAAVLFAINVRKSTMYYDDFM